MIAEATSTHRLSGLVIAEQCSSISHLSLCFFFFADDRLVFFRADAVECWEIRWILHLYELASGQCANFDKSAVCFSTNIRDNRKEYLQSLLGVRLVDNLRQYLGLPSAFTRRNSED